VTQNDSKSILAHFFGKYWQVTTIIVVAYIGATMIRLETSKVLFAVLASMPVIGLPVDNL